MTERQLEQYLCKNILHIGGLCIKLEAQGIKGWPDRTILMDGKTYFVEVKKPEGGVVSHQQRYWLKELPKRGYDARIIRTKEEADAFVTELYDARF